MSTWQRGQALIELLMAIALTGILLPALLTSLVASREGRAQQQQRFSAISLLQRTEDEVRQIRETGWNTPFSTCANPCYPSRNGNAWSFTSGTETIGQLVRRVDLQAVYRYSANDQISPTSSGATYTDPSTYKVVVTVSWTKPFTSQLVSSNYMTRYLSPVVVTDSTVDDFLSGDPTSVEAVTATPGSDGALAIVGGTTSSADWCLPDPSTIYFSDLPKNGTVIRAAYDSGTNSNRVYIGAQTSGSAGITFEYLTIPNVAVPIPTIAGIASGDYSTYSIAGDGTYAYLGTNNITPAPANGEALIFNLSQPTLVPTGWFDVTNETTPTPPPVVTVPMAHIDVSTNSQVGYMGYGNEFWTFDLATKTGARGVLNKVNKQDTYSINPAQNVVAVHARNNYAYVAIDTGSSEELQVYDISNPAAIRYVAWGDLNGDGGREMYVNPEDTRLYFLTNRTTSTCKRVTPGVGLRASDIAGCEFEVIDISDKSQWGITITPASSTPTPTSSSNYRKSFPTVKVIGTYDVDWELTPGANVTATGTMDPLGFAVISESYSGQNKNRAILVGVTPAGISTGKTEEYRVLDLSDETHPVRCGGRNIDAGVRDVSTVKMPTTTTDPIGPAYAYIVTNDAITPAFQMIKGGPVSSGGTGSSGSFTSRPIDAGYTAPFNQFIATYYRMPGTTINFQVAVAAYDISLGCNHSNYTFVGNDITNTSSVFYTSDGYNVMHVAIPVGTNSNYVNPGRCFKYKVTFTSASSPNTSMLYDAGGYYTP